MMKRFLLLSLVVFSICLIPCSVNAETIQDYKNRIAAIQAEKDSSAAKSAEVQQEIDNAKARINEITAQISEAQKTQTQTEVEIKKLDKEIESKEDEIKDLVAFYQISDNDNFYLKFIFGADSFEDFIYRFSIAEQLTEANDNLVDEMNGLIKENEAKIKELESQKKNLRSLNSDLRSQIEKLGGEKREYLADVLDADEEIKVLQEQISFFKKQGCSDTQDVTTCNSGVVPSASGFQLPTSTGLITTWYGYGVRSDIGESTARLHAGIDIAAYGSACGNTVMATNSGKVIFVGYDGGGYGNYVMIVHNSGGNTYTSLYGHMSSVSVYSGQTVSRGQQVGTIGNTGYSFGCHLHFQLMYGWGYGTSFDPAALMNVPYSW